MKILFIFVLSIFACNSQTGPQTLEKQGSSTSQELPNEVNEQLGEYLVNIFEDSKGNLWFATLSKGVAKYDGNDLVFYTAKDGINSDRVGSMVEDKAGNIWFGTHSGISKFDGTTFTNFTEEDGLCSNLTSNFMMDQSGILWIGTWEGISTFDGENFSDFTLPIPDIEIPAYQATTHWVTEIMEDTQGNIWFARDGLGATKYDGKTFTHFNKDDGLASNTLSDILEDSENNIWFGSRISEKDHPDPEQRDGPGGLIKYDGETFTNFPGQLGLYNSDVYNIYRDSKDNLWISTTRNGIYKYDGKVFTNYPVMYSNSKKNQSVMSILEDTQGTIWVGCVGGLFRLENNGFKNLTRNGSWK